MKLHTNNAKHTKTAKFALVPLTAIGALVFTATSPALAGASSSKATKVIAVETEFHIALSKSSFRPGKYVFVAENKGTITHALEITGPGLHSPKTPNLAPGKKANLKVTLKKGKYDIFCPVPGHKAEGMNVNVVVGETLHTTVIQKSTNTTTTKAATTPATTPKPTTTTTPAPGGNGY